MSRLIDADALKRKAQKLSIEAWKINRVARVDSVLNQFVDWIDGAPTIDAESKWTPVSEGLPKEGTEVLVYLYNNPRSPYIAWIEDGKWFTEEFEIESEYEPTEWMELPKAYEVEEE